MSRAQPKSSPTDEYAKKIAQAIAKGRPPPFSEAFDRYCEGSPGEIFAAFTGVARHMPPAGKDEPLAVGYLFVLQRLLEHLRYRVDRGYDDARSKASLNGGGRPLAIACAIFSAYSSVAEDFGRARPMGALRESSHDSGDP